MAEAENGRPKSFALNHSRINVSALFTIVVLQAVQRLQIQDTRTQPLRVFLVDEGTMPPSADGTPTPPSPERPDEP